MAAPRVAPRGLPRRDRGVAGYGSLLRAPAVGPALAWSMLGRLPLGMLPLGLLLLARASGAGYPQATLVAAAYGIALALATPISSVAVDRRGYRRAIVPRAAVFAVAGAGVCFVGAERAPIGVLAALAAAMGIAMPPVTAGTRSAWRALAPSASAHSLALGLDAAAHEFTFVCGPALVAVLAAASPVLAIAVAGGAAAAGGLGFCAVVAGRAPTPGGVPVRIAAGLGRPEMRALIAVALLMGTSLGLLEAAMPAFAEAHGGRDLSGVALACLAAGSAIGALLSLRLWGPGSPRRRLLIATALSPVTMALPIAAGSLPAMDALMLVAGLPLAAALGGAYALVARLAPERAQTASFGWMATALVAGGGAGTALTGQLVAAGGPRLAMAVGAGVALCATVVVVAAGPAFVGTLATGSEAST